MQPGKFSMEDKDIEKIMGNILRYGVLTSALIVLVGAFFYLYQHGNHLPQYREFIREPKRFTEIKDVWKTGFRAAAVQ